jgi:Putative citrate transport
MMQLTLTWLQFGPCALLIGAADCAPTTMARSRYTAYFWLTGNLSSLLDNAPTYLVFFNLAGGDPQELMGPLARNPDRQLGRRGIHGRQNLYRQCAEFHGEVDLRRARRPDAEFLRLHAVVGRHSVAALCSAHDPAVVS